VVSEALRGDDLEKKVAVEVNMLEEDSPYPEVRAAVRNYDDDTSANTVRAYVNLSPIRETTLMVQQLGHWHFVDDNWFGRQHAFLTPQSVNCIDSCGDIALVLSIWCCVDIW
jgi:hypothetical protein